MGPYDRRSQDGHRDFQCVFSREQGRKRLALTFGVNGADWDSVEAHVDFMNSPSFPTFFDKFQAACTSPITWFHTHIKPFPPSELFQADVIELAVLAKKPTVPQDQFEQASSAFFKRIQNAPGYRCHFQGIKHEDGTGNVQVNFVGWDSMEVRVVSCVHTKQTDETYSLLVLCCDAF